MTVEHHLFSRLTPFSAKDVSRHFGPEATLKAKFYNFKGKKRVERKVKTIDDPRHFECVLIIDPNTGDPKYFLRGQEKSGIIQMVLCEEIKKVGHVHI